QEAGEGVAVAWRGGHGGNTDNGGGATLTDGDRGAMTQADGRRIFSRPRKRWRRLLWLVPLLCVAFTVLQVAVLRFVDPPFSAFMAARQFEAWGEGDWSYRIAYDWRDLDAMAPHVPLALVAAEDQRFPDHHGFDIDAIEQARQIGRASCRERGES